MRRNMGIILLVLFLAGCQTVPRAVVKPPVPPPPTPPVPEVVKPQPPKAAPLPGPAGIAPVFTNLAATKAETQRINELISHMSLEQKIGQHFMGHIPRDGISKEMLDNIRKGLYGGFILYPWNYKTESDVRKLTQTLQQTAVQGSPSIKLFLSADQEGGRVTAFRFSHLVRFPAAFYIGEYHDLGMAWANGYINAIELRDLGLNMNFAPVLGLYPKPDSTIIGDRSMGPNAAIVSALGQAYIWGAQEGGIIPVAKHFPGHGAAKLDSHYDLPIVEYTRAELMKKDIRPFVAAIDGGVEAVMTAHILYPKIDDKYPVTLSKIFLQGILRKELGFQGVIITDGLSMGALSKHYPLPETLRRAFDAGADILLDHAVYNVPSMVKQVEAMVHDGQIPMSTVDDGLRRILLLKLRHHLILPSGH